MILLLWIYIVIILVILSWKGWNGIFFLRDRCSCHCTWVRISNSRRSISQGVLKEIFLCIWDFTKNVAIMWNRLYVLSRNTLRRFFVLTKRRFRRLLHLVDRQLWKRIILLQECKQDLFLFLCRIFC